MDALDWTPPAPPRDAGAISTSFSLPTVGQRSWRLRITIPAPVAAAAGFREGMPYACRAVGGRIVLVVDRIDEKAKLFPQPNASGTHTVLIGMARPDVIGLPEATFAASAHPAVAADGWLAFAIPEERTDRAGFVRPVAEPSERPAPPEPIKVPSVRWKTSEGEWTSVAERLLAYEAARSRREIRTLTLGECVNELRALGRRVETVGPRFFKVDGELTQAADLPGMVADALGIERRGLVLIAA